MVDAHSERESTEQSLMASRRAPVVEEAQEAVLAWLGIGPEAVAGLLPLRSRGVLWRKRLVES